MRRASRDVGGNRGRGSYWIRPEKRLAIYHRDDFTCLYCLRNVRDDAADLTLEHVIPRVKGGSNGTLHRMHFAAHPNGTSQTDRSRGRKDPSGGTQSSA